MARTDGDNRVRIRHFLPDVGALEAELFDESRDLYDFLKGKKEINRVQHLTQLGFVQSAWPVARHTRWDATVLLLDLIRRMKDLPSVHIGSKVTLRNDVTVSSARELLSCWALLLNLGHLHGTFAVETELLYEIRRQASTTSFQHELLNAVPADAKAAAERILQEERTYQFFQLLAFYRLAHLGASGEQLIQWQTVLASYVVRGDDEAMALTRARQLFRRARRLAFLTLDASLTPSPLEVRLAQLASSNDAFERLLLPEHGFAVGDEFQSLEDFLAREVYNGRDVLTSLAAGRPWLRRRMAKDLADHGLRHAVESAANADHRRYMTFQRSKPVVRGTITALIGPAVVPGSRLVTERRRLEDAFERWGRVLGARVSVLIAQDARGHQLVFQTHAHRPLARDYACAIVGGLQLNQRLRREVGGLVGGNSVMAQGIVVGGTVGVVEAALQHFFQDARSWEWGHSPISNVCVTGTKREVLEHLDAAVKTPSLDKARRNELMALGHHVRTIQADLMAVAVANLTAYGNDRTTHLAELDGVIVGVDRRRSDLVMCVIEAKYTTSAASRSRKQLRRALAQLGVSKAARRGAVQAAAEGKRGRAWLYLRTAYTT